MLTGSRAWTVSVEMAPDLGVSYVVREIKILEGPASNGKEVGFNVQLGHRSMFLAEEYVFFSKEEAERDAVIAAMGDSEI